MRLLSESSGTVICYDAFIHEIPQVLSRILLDYVDKRSGCPTNRCSKHFLQEGMLDATAAKYITTPHLAVYLLPPNIM